jgi:hypothetical protein
MMYIEKLGVERGTTIFCFVRGPILRAASLLAI